MKTKIYSFAVIIAIAATTLIGCKGKDGEPGAQGPQGQTGNTGQAGPEATTFNFNLTFNAGDTYKSYGGITGYDANDVVLVFALYETLGTENFWVQLPVVLDNFVNIIPEFSSQSGYLFINTLKADGTSGSPWTSSNTISFKAVLIKSRALLAHPGIQLKPYNEIKQILNLKE